MTANIKINYQVMALLFVCVFKARKWSAFEDKTRTKYLWNLLKIPQINCSRLVEKAVKKRKNKSENY